MYTDREAMKRQSTVLLETATSDTRLMQALMQIEQLTNELETLKQDKKDKVSFSTLFFIAETYVLLYLIHYSVCTIYNVDFCLCYHASLDVLSSIHME